MQTRSSVCVITLLCAASALFAQTSFNQSAVKAELKRVADWQVAHFEDKNKHADQDWTMGALYVGMVDWAALAEQVDSNKTYYTFLRKIAERNGYQPYRRMYHADDITVSQLYLELFRHYNDKRMYDPTEARTDWVVAHPSANSFVLKYSDPRTLERWTWCDALFMAPPVYAKMYVITKDKKYLDFMNKEYKATYDYLYDKEEYLFTRDHNYLSRKEKNGKKVFWGRGNGWVIAGLVEILKELPKEEPSRRFYENLFIEMATSLRLLQQQDGYWRASLLDPDAFPSPETSATGFILYGLTYGVNSGLLPKTHFEESIKAGWDALVKAVDKETGKLGYVQPIGETPKQVTSEMTEVYGVGAFLAAGCEIYRLLAN